MSLTETLYACCSTFKATLLKMPSKRLARIAKDRVLAAWEKIGAIPLTRNCLTHPKVRHEAGGVAPAAEMLEALAESHVANQEAGRGIGLNVGVFEAVLPTHTHIAREADPVARVRALAEHGKIDPSSLGRRLVPSPSTAGRRSPRTSSSSQSPRRRPRPRPSRQRWKISKRWSRQKPWQLKGRRTRT